MRALYLLLFNLFAYATPNDDLFRGVAEKKAFFFNRCDIFM
jgi:hypothetical protein